HIRLVGALPDRADVRRVEVAELRVVDGSHGAGGYDEMSGVRRPFCRGMDTKKWTVAVAATAVLGGCAAQPAAKTTSVAPAAAPAPQPASAPQAATPAEALVDHAGDSIETAIAVPADAANGGWNFTNDWIFDRIGKFRRTG